MKSTFFILALLLFYSCQEGLKTASMNQSSVSVISSKDKLLTSNWRDLRWESQLCYEDECQKYYLVLVFTQNSFIHRLYDKVTNKSVFGKDKVYAISNLGADSFILNSNGANGTYSIKGNELEVCIEGEGCYQFSKSF